MASPKYYPIMLQITGYYMHFHCASHDNRLENNFLTLSFLKTNLLQMLSLVKSCNNNSCRPSMSKSKKHDLDDDNEDDDNDDTIDVYGST